jgi:two-component system response regulator GlrR
MAVAPEPTTAPRPVTQPYVLVVEDQDDVRLMLVTVLQMEGYRVDEASNAVDGLRKINTSDFDLVLTDYAMPGGTGTWMLQEAVRLGRLGHTPALVVTAHPELVRPATRFTVVSKPIDLDRFLDQVRRILKMSDSPPRAVQIPTRPVLAKIELVLYISAASPSSMQAQSNMERVLDAFDRSEVAYTVCDLQKNPETADHDRVVFTPTLVKRHPDPRMWIIGDLRDGDVVSDLLRISGVSDVK